MPVNASDIHFWISGIEKHRPFDEYRDYATRHPLIPVMGISIYLILLYAGPKIMQNRKARDLKSVLFLWNTGLALFSILSTIRFASLVLFRYRHFDRHAFFCNTEDDNVTGFWYMLFVYSKFVEFGDTLFLVLRKRRVMFLHWYHHVTVLSMAWLVFVETSAVGPFFGGVNVFIHSLMYAYYAAQTLGLRFPKIVPMILTMLQTTQMLIGLAVIYQTNQYSKSERGCNASSIVTICGSLMYASYFLLFARFFVQAYISSPKRQEQLLDVNQNHYKTN